ncbi:hypothetical protein [Streptomyces xantholiticus]|uniref:Uncharacterized protein n=1 Tax=Streptomyces xantholiticus TaxID=68285 RepID=A0ABV1V5N1_9ACTN
MPAAHVPSVPAAHVPSVVPARGPVPAYAACLPPAVPAVAGPATSPAPAVTGAKLNALPAAPTSDHGAAGQDDGAQGVGPAPAFPAHGAHACWIHPVAPRL